MDNLGQAKECFLRGVHHYQAGQFDQARLQFEASLALAPGRPSTLTNLGATRLKLGHLDEALAILDEALRADPTNPEARGHRTMALAELGRHAEALASVDEVLREDARIAPLWTLRGNLLNDLGRREEAVESFQRALGCGGDPHINGYYLAALTGSPAPPAPPQAYVRALFDGYAVGFDKHLVNVLRYRAPEVLIDGLPDRTFGTVIDLGCGTGLCGARIRSRAARLVGVDLSANMVRQARARNVYDEVVQADIAEFLRAVPAQGADLLLAADVFIYVGALEAVFAAARAALAAGGVFAFTVEVAAEQQNLVLQPSMRYAHSRGYIRSLAAQAGFEIAAMAEHPIREDQGAPIPGLFAWLFAT